jgi:hypothetical protein
MALCERCGSIQIVKGRAEPFEKLVAWFGARRPFVCLRCGWRGLREWSDGDLQRLQNYGSGGAEPDPSLIVLDRNPAPSSSEKREGQESRLPIGTRSSDVNNEAQFDLAAISSEKPPHLDEMATMSGLAARSLNGRGRRRHRNRRRASQRREIVVAIAVSLMMILTVALLGLTEGCSARSLEQLS